MASITQKISSYVHGINEQPDHLKKPGQVNEAHNVLPDITLGLTKRPGSKFIKKLETTRGGKWFSIFRDDQEKYICQYIDGRLNIWSAIDGTPRVVRYNSTPNLINPEDGGVGLPVKPGDEAPDVPGGSVPPTLPVGCDPIVMNQKLTAWLAQRSAVTAAETNLTNITNHYTYIYNNRQQTVQQRQWRWFYYYMIGKNLYRGWTGWTADYSKKHWAAKDEETRIANVTTGTYPVADVTAYYNNTLMPAQVALDAARAAEVPLKKEYEKEAIKCGITSSPITTYATIPVTIPYLSGVAPEDIDVLTVNDYTFITNRKAVTSMGSTTTTKRPYEAFIQMKMLEYGSEYKLDIYSPGTTASKTVTYATALTVEPANWDGGDGACPFVKTETFNYAKGTKVNMRYTLETRGQAVPVNSSDPYSGYKCSYKTYVTLGNGGQGWVTGDSWNVTMEGRTYTVRVKSHATRYVFDQLVPITPYLTPQNPATESIKYDTILNHFKTEIEKVFGWHATVISTGLYIEGPVEFAITTTGGKSDVAIEAFTNKVNNIAKLPLQCKDGYVVKILNTGEQEDDYYVQFIGTEKGVDGAGAWEETIAPGVQINFNYTTMPHQLVRMPDGTFMFSPIDWENRLVGDNKTNPKPSFVDRTINKMAFYRNRLVMLSDENIILSAAGDFFNFWAKTAITISDSDPIDLAATSTTPCVLSDCIAMQAGLILFSRDKQFLFGTSQDTLSPTASKIEVLSTYPYNIKVPVIDMGTTVGFLTRAGTTSRFFEMTNIQANVTPEILEQSKIVSSLLPSTINDIADSKENSIIAFGVNDEKKTYLYRYFNDGQQRVLSSWFTWELPGELIYHTIDKDTYYTVVMVDGGVTLCTSNLITNKDDYIVYGTEVSYEPRLDVRYDVLMSEVTYDFRTETSTFSIPHPADKDRLVLFGAGEGKYQGRVASPISVTANTTTGKWDVVVKGDWSKMNISCGYPFSMSVRFPTTYVTKTEGEKAVTDTRSYLTVSRCKLGFGNVGYFSTRVKRKGNNDYLDTWESSPSDEYEADTHEVLPTAFKTIPLYQKNQHFTLTLTSDHPTPATLLSMEWEGQYSPMYYKSV